MCYSYHRQPTGATPVPADANGTRAVEDWQFHYKGWEKDDGYVYRSGATRENMFPDERKGCLDVQLLKKLDLNAARMEETDGAPDALFFYQLLLPICDTKRNGIVDDPRMSFYPHVTRCSNTYASYELGLGGDYGHHFKTLSSPEILKWDGSVVKDGVRGGSKGAMMLRFDKRSNDSAFDKEITDSFTRTRWLEIKRVIKLNNNISAPKKGMPGYNPAYKYDFLYKCLVYNVNALTKYADLDGCGDESTWGNGGFGIDIIGYLKNKPVTRGGQTDIFGDVFHIRPRAYLHWHRQCDFHFGQQGRSEVYMICENLKSLTLAGKSKNPFRPVPIYREKPHMTWDNFFSGDSIMQYCVDEGFPMTMTCRRDRLPGQMPSKHLCKEKTGNPQARAARFNNPIVAVNDCEMGCRMQLTSFQSMSSCNFMHVNALNSCQLYADTKERGRKEEKRRWAIEMYEGRDLYLKTYGAIDRLDHYIKNCNMGYRCALSLIAY